MLTDSTSMFPAVLGKRIEMQRCAGDVRKNSFYLYPIRGTEQEGEEGGRGEKREGRKEGRGN